METLYEEVAEKHPGAGLHDGLQVPRDKWGHRLSDTPFKCENCGREFFRAIKETRRRVSRYCSLSCRNIASRGQLPACVERFITPPSTKAQRIRANGLVNMRERRGWFVAPTNCQKCGVKKRLDKHHPDYTKPDEVYFVCRSCHMLTHQDPAYMAGIMPVKLADRPSRVPHGKGGRRGPTGKALGRHPFLRIVDAVSDLGEVVETLTCGHTHTRPEDGRRPIQRRCRQCPRLSPALAVAKGGRA